ncbi:TPA: DUF4809 family protein [Enterococcus faecalis]
MGEETMQEAIITSTVDLTSGGCNACGLVEDTVYTLAMNGVDIPLDGLTVAHLVSAVVARNGFKQELQMDMLDDEYIFYRKEDTAVTFKEAYNHLSYDNGSEKIQSKNKLEDLPELFEQVNQILTTVFGIETVNFIIE